MAPPPAMKSRGMSFAEKQLQRHGWTEGKGLGRRENGISEAIKVKVKCDTAGVGHDSAEQFTFHWWDHVFNKTASSIAVETDRDGVQVKKVSEGDDETVTNKKPRKAHAHRDMLYGRFIKSATLLSGGEKPMEKEDSSSESSDGNGDEDEKLDLSSATKLTDEDLVKICGGRTAHKGARHGLTMSAKLLRIEEQERAFLEKYGKKKLKNDTNKSNGRHTEDERMERPCSQEEIDGATPDSASDSTGTKKKKMKSSTDEDGPSKKKCPKDDVEFLDYVNGLDSCEEGTKTKVAVKETSTVQFTEEELKCSKKKKKKKAADEEDIVMTNDLEDVSVEDNPRRKKKRKRKDNEDHHVPPEEEAQKTSKKRRDNDEERKEELSNSYQEHVPPGEEAQKTSKKRRDNDEERKEELSNSYQEHVHPGEEAQKHSKKKKKRKDNEQERMDELSNGCQEHVPPGEEAQKHSKKKKKRKDNEQERMDELSNGSQEHVPPGEEAQKHSKKKKKRKDNEQERMDELSNGYQEHVPPGEEAQKSSKKKKKKKGSEDERMEEPSNGSFPPEEQAQIPSKKKKKQKSVHFSDAGEHEPKEATEEQEWSENMYREEEDCKDLKKKKKSKSKHSNHPL